LPETPSPASQTLNINFFEGIQTIGSLWSSIEGKRTVVIDQPDSSINPIAAREDGQLADAISLLEAGKQLPETRNADELRCGFHFGGYLFTCKASRRKDREKALLVLCGNIGYLPFSNQSSFVRRAVRRLISPKNKLRYGEFVVQPSQRLLLLCETDISSQMHFQDIVAGLCRMIIDAKPHLDLIKECMEFTIPPDGISIPAGVKKKFDIDAFPDIDEEQAPAAQPSKTESKIGDILDKVRKRTQEQGPALVPEHRRGKKAPLPRD